MASVGTGRKSSPSQEGILGAGREPTAMPVAPIKRTTAWVARDRDFARSDFFLYVAPFTFAVAPPGFRPRDGGRYSRWGEVFLGFFVEERVGGPDEEERHEPSLDLHWRLRHHAGGRSFFPGGGGGGWLTQHTAPQMRSWQPGWCVPVFSCV